MRPTTAVLLLLLTFAAGGIGPIHEWLFLRLADAVMPSAIARLEREIFLPPTDRAIAIAVLARRAERSGARHRR